MGDLIDRQTAIDALDEQIEQCNKALGSFDISPKDEYAIKVERASLEAYKEQLENMPSAQPDHVADIGKKVSISCAHENDVISRKAAIDALARMMPRSYTPDGSHPADEEIFRAQEVFVDCIEALEILPSVQPEIVKCKDCKYNVSSHKCLHPESFFLVPDDNFYCGYAERRTDG